MRQVGIWGLFVCAIATLMSCRDGKRFAFNGRVYDGATGTALTQYTIELQFGSSKIKGAESNGRMQENRSPHSRGRFRPGFASSLYPLEQRAQGRPGADRTRSSPVRASARGSNLRV